MEDQAPELTAENVPNICSDASHAISPCKEGVIVASHQPDDNFSSPTPVKMKEPSRLKNKEELTELPHEFCALLEFFDRMTCSLRLLSLRRRTPSFQNISGQVEILTGRKFLFMHLAQIKYILPEAVQINKILTHDETTNCMKSDINISLQFDIVKDHHEVSVFLALSKIFLSRLRYFYTTRPQQNHLPEAVLPEPFSHRSISSLGDSISEDSLTFCELEAIDSSHLPPHFKRCFNQKAAAVSRIENTDLISPVKSPSDANLQINVAIENPQSVSGISLETQNVGESTPMKLFTGSNSLFVETPVQTTPTRLILPTRSVTCEDENKTNLSQNSTLSSSSAKKSLDFYGMGGKDAIFSQKQKSVSLFEFVLLIHQIFRSVNFCSITKEELVQKIIANHLEIDDQGEVEMQLEHLDKLVPDWFDKKLEPSGYLLYRVKKVIPELCL